MVLCIPIDGSPQPFFLLGAVISKSSGANADDCNDADVTCRGERIMRGPTIAVSSDKLIPVPLSGNVEETDWELGYWLKDGGALNRTLLVMVR